MSSAALPPDEEYDEEAAAESAPDGAEAAMGEATKEWFGSTVFGAAFDWLQHVFRTTGAMHKRLAVILLDETPSPAAQSIFDEHVAVLGWSLSQKAVDVFEKLDREEKAAAHIDKVISISSREEAEKWLVLALAQIKHDGRLPPLPQLTDPSALRGTASKTRGELLLLASSFAPLVSGINSPHLNTDEFGHVKAVSFCYFEVVFAELLRRSGLGHLPVGPCGRPRLVGDIVHILLDAYPGVTPVGVPGVGNQRVDSEKLCRDACDDPALRAAALDYLVARLRRMKGEGFERVVL